MEKSLDIIYNKKYLVIVPTMSEELLDSFEYTFGNSLLTKNDLDEISFYTQFINQNNFQQIIFVDFQLEYLELIDKLDEKHDIKFIFTKSLASLSDTFFYDVFKNIVKLYNQEKISAIGFLDNNLYEVLKKKYKNIFYLLLDREECTSAQNKNDKTIGILNNQEDPKHSYYNELSAIKLLDGYTAKITKPSKVNKEFLKTFDIQYKVVKNAIKNNEINLYINFTNNNYLLFLESMDNNIPCILGNTSILDNNKKLKEYLVMKSDDDVNEIADRVKNAIKNKKEILKLYSDFRKEYKEETNKRVEKFTGIEKNINLKEMKYDKLLSVIVPVYNVEGYLAKSLQSILDARIDDMEILVINDGSKDNSEEIALKFQKKYPNIIRYIKQENHGLGNVRNVGLKEAKGKYIASIDSDDTININFFTDAEEYMNKNVDMIIYDWLTVTDKEKYPTAALDYIYIGKNRYRGILYTTIMPSQCNKIIKKELYDRLKINYIEDKYEDLSTNPIVLMATETIKYINKPYYEYYIRSNSIMRSSPGYSMIDVIGKVNKRLEQYKKYCNLDLQEFKFNIFYWRIEQYIINPLFDLEGKELDKMIEYIEKNIKDLYLDLLNSKFGEKMINNIKNKKLQENIIKRNKMINKGELKEFIIKFKKQKEKYSLTPPIIVYGE